MDSEGYLDMLGGAEPPNKASLLARAIRARIGMGDVQAAPSSQPYDPEAMIAAARGEAQPVEMAARAVLPMVMPTQGSPGAAALSALTGGRSDAYAAPGIYSPVPDRPDDPRAALRSLGSDEEFARAMPLVALQAAYHGTPHAWEGAGAPLEAAKGKTFDLSKIGTGEGAQAYGWGAYATKDPKIAESYRKALAGTDRLSPGAQPPAGSMAARMSAALGNDGDNWTLPSGARAEQVAKKYARNVYTDSDGAAHYVFRDGSRFVVPESGAWWDVNPPSSPGRLYKLEAPEDEEMLHWEKPLSEQPHVLAAIAKDPGLQAGLKPHNFKWRGDEPTVDPSRISMTGEAYHRALADALGERGAAEALRSAGIPGHLYRGGASGVENMVIYDPARAPVTDAYTSLSQMQALANAVRNGG